MRPAEPRPVPADHRIGKRVDPGAVKVPLTVTKRGALVFACEPASS